VAGDYPSHLDTKHQRAMVVRASLMVAFTFFRNIDPPLELIYMQTDVELEKKNAEGFVDNIYIA